MGLVRNYRRSRVARDVSVRRVAGALQFVSAERPRALDRARSRDLARAVRNVAAHERSRLSQQDARPARASARTRWRDYMAGMPQRRHDGGAALRGDRRRRRRRLSPAQREHPANRERVLQHDPAEAEQGVSKHRPIVALRKTGVEYVEVRTLDLNSAGPRRHESEPAAVHRSAADLLSPRRTARRSTRPSSRRSTARDLTVAREGRRPGAEDRRAAAANARLRSSAWNCSRRSATSRSCSTRRRGLRRGGRARAGGFPRPRQDAVRGRCLQRPRARAGDVLRVLADARAEPSRAYFLGLALGAEQEAGSTPSRSIARGSRGARTRSRAIVRRLSARLFRERLSRPVQGTRDPSLRRPL